MAKKLSLNLPPFYKDPLYQKTQDILFPFGSDLLAGKPNDYYKPIGESGGAEFEKMLALTTRDMSKAVSENLVRRGISRSGLGANVVAKTAADVSTKLRWEDYSRALAGKEFLMNSGLNTLSTVQGGALNITGQKNDYNFRKANLDFQIQQINAKAAAERNAMWSKIAMQAVGLIAAPFTGGLSLGLTAGATGGFSAALGSASGGSGSLASLGALL